VTLLIAGDAHITRLNRKYLKRQGATDVMAFSMREGKRLHAPGEALGDVVISVDRARAQAGRFGNTFRKELALYAVHGVLHLTGFKDGSKQMEKLQERIADEFFKH